MLLGRLVVSPLSCWLEYGPSDLLSRPVQDLLRSLGARLPSSSMSVEGLLAQMKAATPRSRHAPTMGRQVHTGLLAQVMHTTWTLVVLIVGGMA